MLGVDLGEVAQLTRARGAGRVPQVDHERLADERGERDGVAGGVEQLDVGQRVAGEIGGRDRFGVDARLVEHELTVDVGSSSANAITAPTVSTAGGGAGEGGDESTALTGHPLRLAGAHARGCGPGALGEGVGSGAVTVA